MRQRPAEAADMVNRNVFELARDGRLARVSIWTGGENALQ